MKYIKTAILVLLEIILFSQVTYKLDSLERLVENSTGIERCIQTIKLFREFENQEFAGSIPFPLSYYDYVDECILIAEKENNVDILNSLKISKAALHIRKGKSLSVFTLVNEVLSTGRPLDLYDSLDAYVFLSSSCHNLGLFEKELQVSQIKNRLARILNRDDVLGEWSTNVAMVYYKLKVYNLAADNFKRLVDQYIAEENYYMAASHFNNLGLTYKNWHKTDSALIFYNEAIKYVNMHYNISPNDIERDFFTGMIKGNIAEIYFENGETTKGIELTKLDLAASRRIGNHENAVRSCLMLANAYLELNNKSAARKYLDSAEILIETGESHKIDQIISVGELKAGILFELKEFEKSGEIYQKVNHLKDSLLKQENNRAAIISNSIYQVYEKENELIREKASIAKLESKRQVEKQQKNILYIIAFVLLLFIVLIYVALKKKAKSNIQLLANKQEIESQKLMIQNNLEEKETLLKEIQHRVKNNLQVISGMLQLQAGSSDHPEIVQIMDEANDRIKAMAIIHQQLYQNSDNLRYISFNDYLNELLRQVSGTYKRISGKVSIKTFAENIHFDVATAIPLGLIINELTTNAFKYAFNGINNGKLSVKIVNEYKSTYTLTVKDNGVGLPENFDINTSKSLGLKLVRILSKQLKGSFEYISNTGSCFIVTFNDNIAK